MKLRNPGTSHRRLALSGLAAATLAVGAVAGTLPNASASEAPAAGSSPATSVAAAKTEWETRYVVTGLDAHDEPQTTRINMWYDKNGIYLQHNNGAVGYEGMPPTWTITSVDQMTWREVRTLPTEINALRTTLNRRLATVPKGSESVLNPMTQLLAGPVRREVRPRVFQVLREAKLIVHLGAKTDSVGRTGTALRENDGTYVRTVIFNAVGLPLEETVRQGGAVIETTTWFAPRWTVAPTVDEGGAGRS